MEGDNPNREGDRKARYETEVRRDGLYQRYMLAEDRAYLMLGWSRFVHFAFRSVAILRAIRQ